MVARHDGQSLAGSRKSEVFVKHRRKQLSKPTATNDCAEIESIILVIDSTIILSETIKEDYIDVESVLRVQLPSIHSSSPFRPVFASLPGHAAFRIITPSRRLPRGSTRGSTHYSTHDSTVHGHLEELTRSATCEQYRSSF